MSPEGRAHGEMFCLSSSTTPGIIVLYHEWDQIIGSFLWGLKRQNNCGNGLITDLKIHGYTRILITGIIAVVLP